MDEERIGLLSSTSDNVQEINSSSLALGGENGFDIKSNGHRSKASALKEVSELKKSLQKETELKMVAEKEVNRLKLQLTQLQNEQVSSNSEIMRLHKLLENETLQKVKLVREITTLHTQILQMNLTAANETRRNLEDDGSEKTSGALDSVISQLSLPQIKDPGNAEKPPVRRLIEQGMPPEMGLQKIVSLLESDEPDVRIQAVKVIANLAAEDENQKQIVEAGGLTSLLMLLRSAEDDYTRRVAAGAIANLAMNGANQELIMDQGGIGLLSSVAANVQDPQTLRMVAGAIANLCGNVNLLTKLRSEGGIAALLGIVGCGYPDVIAQIVRGFSNFVKCEGRSSSIQGTERGKSLLIEEGALSWIVQNAKIESSAIRRHIELTLCHLAQQEENVEEMVKEGAISELVRISKESSREDIRSLAHRTLTSCPALLTNSDVSVLISSKPV